MKILKYLKSKLIASNLTSIPKWFTWHLLPNSTDNSIKSVSESIFYIFIIVLLLYCGNSFLKIKVHRESIEIECIDPPLTCNYDSSYIYIAPSITIDYSIPITETDLKPKERYIQDAVQWHGQMIVFYDWFAYEEHGHIRSTNINKELIYRDSIRNAVIANSGCYINTTSDPISEEEWKNKAYTNKYGTKITLSHENEKISNYRKKLDSLYSLSVYSEEKKYRYPAYYICTTTTLQDNYSWKALRKAHKEENNNNSLKGTFWYNKKEQFIDSHHVKTEYYVSGPFILLPTRKCASSHLAYDKCNLCKPLVETYNKPGWFTMEDFTQKYFEINLKSSTIDSVILKFDFVGATNFSQMSPAPDIITMSSIEFNSPYKIKTIKEQGLRFHASFPELQNMQSIRMFFVTTILGGILIIILVMVIILVIRLINHKKFKQTDSTGKDMV